MKRHTMRNRGIEDGLAVLAGLGVGALTMYLLDPRSGARRRQRLALRTRAALEAAGDTIAPVVSGVASGAAKVGHRVAESVGQFGSHLAESGSHYASEAAESISHHASDLSEQLSDRASRLWNRTRRKVAGSNGDSRHVPVAPVAAGGIGLLALGAGLAWLFDPDLGEARRHWLRDKAFSFVRDIGDLCRKTGKHLSNRAYGAYAETRALLREGSLSDRQLESRVRSHLGHVIGSLSDLTVIADAGRITLVGSLPQEQIATAITAAQRVRGVHAVEDQLRPRHQPSPSAS